MFKPLCFWIHRGDLTSSWISITFFFTSTSIGRFNASQLVSTQNYDEKITLALIVRVQLEFNNFSQHFRDLEKVDRVQLSSDFSPFFHSPWIVCELEALPTDFERGCQPIAYWQKTFRTYGRFTVFIQINRHALECGKKAKAHKETSCALNLGHLDREAAWCHCSFFLTFNTRMHDVTLKNYIQNETEILNKFTKNKLLLHFKNYSP